MMIMMMMMTVCVLGLVFNVLMLSVHHICYGVCYYTVRSFHIYICVTYLHEYLVDISCLCQMARLSSKLSERRPQCLY